MVGDGLFDVLDLLCFQIKKCILILLYGMDYKTPVYKLSVLFLESHPHHHLCDVHFQPAVTVLGLEDQPLLFAGVGFNPEERASGDHAERELHQEAGFSYSPRAEDRDRLGGGDDAVPEMVVAFVKLHIEELADRADGQPGLLVFGCMVRLLEVQRDLCRVFALLHGNLDRLRNARVVRLDLVIPDRFAIPLEYSGDR